MLIGIVICSLPPFLASIFKKPSWGIVHPDLVLLDAPAVATPVTDHSDAKTS